MCMLWNLSAVSVYGNLTCIISVCTFFTANTVSAFFINCVVIIIAQTDYQARAKEKQKEDEALSKERKLQEAMISVKKKYGKNAMLKGMNLEEGATTISRNNQIGVHKA